MRRGLTAVVVCSAALSLVPACQRRGERAEARGAHDRDRDGDRDNDHDESHDEAHTSSVPGAGGETRSAVRNISDARCDREARCNNVGNDKKYASDEVCEDQIKSEWANDLNAYECPKGVVDGELEECLNAIRNEDCNSPFDTLGRISACTAGQICAN
jgi:hypothetical protein